MDKSATKKPGKLPQLVESPELCCGCGACRFICPVNAIDMKPDEKGFLYPVVDAQKCVGCGKCLEACVFKKDREKRSTCDKVADNAAAQVYAARLKDRTALAESASGGAFSAVSDVFLTRGDAVACCTYDAQTHTAGFHLALTQQDRDRARGSKYMQSDPGDIYDRCISWLKENPEKNLLFTGMGCQGAAFRQIAKMKGVDERVWIADIICHGAPSPKLWRDYIRALEEKYGPVQRLNFRDKRTGWAKSTALAVFDGAEVPMKDYMRVFFDNYILRQSCYQCPYTVVDRDTDLTIGDFWHIEEKLPEFFDPMGNSLILIHTDKGRQLFEQMKDDMEFCRSNYPDCWQMNLEKPTQEPDRYTQFWRDYQKHGSKYVFDKYGNITLLKRVKNKVRRVLKKFLR